MEEQKEETITEETATEETVTEEIEDEAAWKKTKKLCIIAAIGLAAAVYLGASIFYGNHLYWNTYINGTPFYNYVPANADLALNNRGEEYSLLIMGRNGESAVISAEQIGLSYHYETSAEEIKSRQNALLWPKSFLESQSYAIDYTVSYNEAQLKDVLAEVPFLQRENMSQPENAYIGGYNKELGCFEVVSETEGTLIDPEEVYGLVCDAIERGNQVLRLEEYGCYVMPEIMSDNEALLSELDYYNKFMQASVTYQFGAEEEVVDFTVYGDWVRQWGNTNTLIVDEDAVEEYLQSLADKYDTYNNKMNFTTVDGYVLNLPRGGFGWKMDVEAEKELLIRDIKTGAVDVREPLYSCQGATRENDIGDFYIEVNMTEQRVYVIDHGEVVLESNCVTGNMSNGCDTPPGIFGLTYKQRNATLRGRGYVSYVRYWMPFNGNIGFHDASWRGLFGGDIYLTSGSHGCINLPTPFAEQLYDIIYKDCPVICYYLTDDVIVETPEDRGLAAANEDGADRESEESEAGLSGSESSVSDDSADASSGSRAIGQ